MLIHNIDTFPRLNKWTLKLSKYNKINFLNDYKENAQIMFQVWFWHDKAVKSEVGEFAF